MVNDQLRRAEQNPRNPDEGFIGGGGPSGYENLGAPKPQGPEDQLPELTPPPGQQPDDDRHRGRDEIEDRAKKKLEDKVKGKGEGEGAKPGGKGAAEGGGEGGFGKAGGQAGEELGKKAAQKGAQQAGQAGARAGAGAAGEAGAGAGAGAAGAGAGAGAAGAGAGAGAGAAGAGAAAGGAAAGTGAAAGVAGGGAAAGGAVAATTGAETAGIGAAVGAAIVVIAVVAGVVIKYWKEFAALGAILFVGILILGVAFLNGLKPIASTVETASKYLSPIQQIVDTRSIDVVGRFITGGSGAAIALHEQQEHVAANSQQGEGRVLQATSEGLVTDGKLKTLFDAMERDGFEERIEARFGLTFEPGNGSIRILRYGQELGQAYSSADAERILRNNFPDLQRLLNEELNGWSWAQHTKVGRPMRGEYDIQALAIPGAESAHDAAQLVDVVKYQVSSVLRSGLGNMQRGLSCFVGGSDCNDFGIQVDPAAYAEYQSNENSSLAQTTQAAYDETLEGISPENNYHTGELAPTASNRISQQIGEGEGNAIGLLGWLDIAAAAHKMSQKDNAQQLPSLMRGKQAGALWAWNLSAINQMVAGDVSGRASALITRNYRDIESSQGYNYVAYNDVSRGQGMPDSNKVLSRLQKPFETLYQHVLVENPLIQTTIGAAFTGWRVLNGDDDIDIPIIGGIIGGFLGGIGSLSRPVIIALAEHTPMGTFINRFAGFILQELGIVKFVEDTLGLSSKLMLPVCDPSDRTYDFFNCMATGAHNVANWACVENFACHKLTLAQTNEIIAASQADMEARIATMPLMDRLFNQARPRSLVNVAALHSPIPIKATENATAFAQSLFTTVWSTPQRLAALFSGSARAATADSSIIDGQDTFGIPLETLHDTPLANQLSAANGVCPETEPGEANMCKTDTATVDALIARYTYNPAYPDENPAVGNAGNVQVGSAAQLAAEILANPKISYWSVSEAQVKSDLQRTANGQPANNPACGGTVAISPNLLWAVNEAAKKYSFSINSLVSDRNECSAYHPQGKAMDVGNINGIPTTGASLSGTVHKQFATDISGWIASVSEHGGLGQKQCMGNLSLPSSIYYGDDTCNHIHFSADTDGSSF